MSSVIAKRYAKALLASSADETEWVQIESELKSLTQNYPASILRQLLENPAFHPEEQLQALKALGLNQKVLDCIRLLIENNRNGLLLALSQSYAQELDVKLGRMRAQITSARPLSDQELEQVSTSLFGRLGKTVIPESRIDDRVMAGVKAQLGGLVFDATLESQFSELRRVLCKH